MQIVVNSSSSLIAALNAASGGDVIQLAPGQYSGLLLQNLSFDKPVTITSLDPDAQAVINNFVAKDVHGLTFQNLEFEAVGGGSAYWAFRVANSSDLTFDHLDVHGSLDGNPQNDAFGIHIRTSSNVTVSNSDFHELGIAITHLDSEYLKITGNNIHTIRWDGIDGGGSRHVVVSENYLTDFHPMPGDHQDAIQFWTTGTSRAGSDILVTNNVIVRGDGVPMQGVFIQDEAGDKQYTDVTVADNLLIGTLYNGIVVSHADGVKIADNTVISLPDQTSWIGSFNVVNATMTGNSSAYYNTTKAGGLVSDHNSTIAVASDGGVSALKTWLANHAQDDLALPTDAALGDATHMFTVLSARAAEVVTVEGTAGADTLRVDGFHDTVLRGGAGNDSLISASSGHNTLIGGAGDDVYTVRSTSDLVQEDANAGTDRVMSSVDYTLPDNVESLILQAGATTGIGNELNNSVFGTSDNDTLSGMDGNDVLQGNAGDDLVYGGLGADTVNGGDGSDTVSGGDGDDRVNGNAGSDSLVAGAGKDIIEGGEGADTMSGGAGADVFVFRETGGLEHITDFSHAEGDRIALNMIDANTQVAGDNAFAFIGTDVFHHKAGELRYEVHADGAYLFGDTNGDGVADLQIFLDSVKSLQASDFWL